MNLMRLVFSFHGRMGRAQFLYVNIALGSVLFVLGTLASVFAPDQDREPMQLLPFFVGLMIIWLLSSLIARFHPRHRTKSGDQTSLIYGRDKVGFTWQLLSICIPDASSDGPWIGG